MATAYNADTMNDSQLTSGWTAAQSWIRYFSFNIANTTSSAGFVINDTLNFCPIPYKTDGSGVMMVDFHIELPALDTGSSATVSLGDTNGAANAFQALWYSAIHIGNNAPGIMTGFQALDNVTARNRFQNTATPTNFVANLPKLYAISTLYSGYTAWPTIQFTMKIIAAPNTATTTGTIRGWLLLQTYSGATGGSF